jgi:dihydrofolate reductase
MISIIVAASTNNVIGKQGELPWRLSNDLRRFKKITMGYPIVMGRLTYESIGRPLPGRQNIVITRQRGYVAEGCDVVTSTEAAILIAGDAAEVMIIGGGEIYSLFLPLADRIYLTRVLAHIEGDAHFASLDQDEWHRTSGERHSADEDHDFDFTFEIWDRVEQSAQPGTTQNREGL